MKLTDPPTAAFEEPDSKGAIEGRDAETGRFLSGNKLGCYGRKKGARARWSEAFMADVEEAWKEMGPAAIRRALFVDPAGTIRALIGILPKQAKLEITTPLDGISDERLEQMIEELEAKIGALPGDGARRVTVIDANPTPLPAPAVTIEALATPPSRRPGRDAAAAAKRAELEDQASASAVIERRPVRPYPVGRPLPRPDHEIEAANRRPNDDEGSNPIDPASLF